MKISIGTTSELKIRALKDALGRLDIDSEILSVEANSLVPNQPFGFKDMIMGAKNRAKDAKGKTLADISVGIESGIVEIGENYFDIACVFVITKDGEESTAFSSGICIPNWMINEVKEKNTEIGEITKRLSGNAEKDAFSFFSEGKIKREESISQAILLAFVKIINKDKYKEK